MSSTNSTPTIGLSQYVGTDKPTYLSDYNSDMLKIDNAIAADRDSIATAQSKADGADAKADANASAISDLDTEVNNGSNGLAKRITDIEADVNTIESLIGNGTPTTTDKTIIGAINELATKMPDAASAVSYDNSDSGLSATNVQDAIDELSNASGVVLASVIADGVKTYATLLSELWTAIQPNISKVGVKSKIKVGEDIYTVTEISAGVIIGTYSYIQGTTYKLAVQDIRISSTPQWLTGYMSNASTGTWEGADSSNIVPNNGVVISVIA